MGFFRRIWKEVAVPLGGWMTARPTPQIELACVLLVLAIGATDFSLGTEITIAAAYVVPVSLAAWFVGAAFAGFIAVFATAVWIASNVAGGQGTGMLAWSANGMIRVVSYSFLIFVLVRLNRLQKGLEARGQERAVALAREIAERERLEHDMLEISEREQRRIGQDLHDGLCQHLTGTALAGHALAEKLAAGDRGEASSARKIVDLVEEAIALARGMAKGLHPVELQADGLMQALEEFAYTTSEMFGVECQFDCQVPVLVRLPAAATHLYRIAQEGVGNAIKHGKATKIVIFLEESETALRLAVLDNGKGFPDSFGTRGMGLRIMADRAKMIGGYFSVGRNRPDGSAINCLVPRACLMPSEHHA
jgi:signal transduction histidine kinase